MKSETSAEIQAIFDQRTRKNCSCNPNMNLFKSVLSEYIDLRLQVHRERKRGRIPYTLLNSITMTRRRLEFLAPCQDCIEQLNPTGRKKSAVWNPSRPRAYKECLM